MSDNTGYDTCVMYMGIKTHFTTKTYDYLKYRGKVNLSKDAYLKRNDKYSFEKLARKRDLLETKDFILANFVYGNEQWIRTLLSPEGEKAYEEWSLANKSLTYTFENDIMHLLELVDNPSELFKVVNGQHPIILRELMGKSIKFETLVIMNDLLNLFPIWDKKITDDIIWPQYRMKCIKYTPFIYYDKPTFKAILKERVKENA